MNQKITCQWVGQQANKTINLYLYFTEADFTVTFDPQGGTVSPKTKTYTYLSPLRDLPLPERTGYDFAGWYLNGSQVKDGDLFEETSNCTFEARWTPKPFTIDVVKQNCNLNVTPKSGKYGDSIQISWSPFALEGMMYKFQKMILRTPEGTVLASYADGYSPQTYTMDDEYYPELVVEGRYLQSPISYTIRFDGHGGSVSLPDIQASFGVVYNLPPNGATRKGYALSGWRAGSATGERLALGAAVSNLTATAGATYTFYADWTANVSTNVYHGNGSDAGAMTEQSATYDRQYSLSANQYSRTGYAFAGWTTNLSHAAEFVDRQYVSNLTPLAGGKVDFYATWQANAYRCAFNGNGATSGSIAAKNVHYDEVFALPLDGFERTGYTLSGWRAGSSTGEHLAFGASVSNLTATAGATYTFYADWTANISTNVYHGNGSDAGAMAEQSVAYDQPYALFANQYSRAGYAFAGWTTNLAHAAEFDDGGVVSNLTAVAGGKVDFYATWQAVSYRCVFDGNGADSGFVAPKDVQYDEVFTLPENGFVRSGFIFEGWSTNVTEGTVFQPGDSLSNLTVCADAEVPIFARWQIKPREDLTDLNIALDYYDSPVSNAVKSLSPIPGPTADSWLIVTNAEQAAKGTQYAFAEVTDGNASRRRMGAWVKGPATVTFQMKTSGLELVSESPFAGRFLGVEFRGAEIPQQTLTNIVENVGEWTTVTLSVPSDEGWVIWDLNRTSAYGVFGSCSAGIDHLTISSAGPHPEPGPGDAPTVSAIKLANGKFGIGFVGDVRFDYQLLGTGSLQPADWQLVPGTLCPGTGESQEIEVTVDPLRSPMFYKVEVLKKQ